MRHFFLPNPVDYVLIPFSGMGIDYVLIPIPTIPMYVV